MKRFLSFILNIFFIFIYLLLFITALRIDFFSSLFFFIIISFYLYINYLIIRKKNYYYLLITGLILFIITFIIPYKVSKNLYNLEYERKYSIKRYSDYKKYNLEKEEFTFKSNKNQKLRAFKYYKKNHKYQDIIVFSHGLGSGGHQVYLPLIKKFVDNNYLVLTYNITANFESEGRSINGIPQGIIDLDYFLKYIEKDDKYKNYKINLVGHSWGGYSVLNVLNKNHRINSVVAFSSFNTSIEIVDIDLKKYFKDINYQMILPYISLYERFKMGRESNYNAIKILKNKDTKIMILHSRDDLRLPFNKTSKKLYDKYKYYPNIKFKIYKNRGHRPFTKNNQYDEDLFKEIYEFMK